MSKVEANGITVHYQTKGEGADVVLVHGLTSSLAYWYGTKVFPTLSKEFRVTAYDLRGHGYSTITPTGYTSRELAEDLAALFDKIGIERASLIGHSFGGSVALHFALLYPQRVDGVVLSDTGFAALTHLRNIDNWSGWETWKDQLASMGITREWFAEADTAGIDVVLAKSLKIPVQFGMRRGSSRDTPRFRKLLNETSVSKDFSDPSGLTEDRFSDITPPVLAVYGQESLFLDVAGHLAGTLPNCRKEIIRGAGHFYLMIDPDAFLDTIRPFLRDPGANVASSATTQEHDTSRTGDSGLGGSAGERRTERR